jgi:hypothetical protein
MADLPLLPRLVRRGRAGGLPGEDNEPVISFAVPDYLRTGGPERAFAAARRVALRDGEARRRAIVAANTPRERAECLPECVPCARGLPRDGQVYRIDGAPYAHVRAPRLGTR